MRPGKTKRTQAVKESAGPHPNPPPRWKSTSQGRGQTALPLSISFYRRGELEGGHYFPSINRSTSALASASRRWASRCALMPERTSLRTSS